MKYKVGMNLKKVKAGNGGLTNDPYITLTAKGYGDWWDTDEKHGSFSEDYLTENYEVVEENSMLKYKVGDKVIIRDDLVVGTHYCMEDKSKQNSFVAGMVPSMGKIATISSITDMGRQYKIDLDFWTWTDEMIKCKVEEEKMNKFKVGDIVKGTSNSYAITTKDMTAGKVTHVDADGIFTVKVIAHTNSSFVGEEFSRLDPSRFELYEEKLELAVGDSVFCKETGLYGVVEEMDDTTVPFKIRFSNDEVTWFNANGTIYSCSGKDTIVKVSTDVNLVFVQFAHQNKQYTFKVPNGVKLSKGDKVYVKTARCQTPVTCSTDSFIVTQDAAKNILGGLDATALQMVIGKAVEKTTHELQSF